MNTTQIVLFVIAILLIGFGYGKSKTWASKLRFTLIPIAIAASAAFIHFLIGCWEFNNLGNLSEENLTSVYQLQIIPLFPIAYCFLASVAICFCAWKKEGFTNLEKFEDEGILSSLVDGLVGGVVFGFIVGSIVGLVLLGELIIGVIVVGFAFWLVLTFIIVGLIIGFLKEFNKTPKERLKAKQKLPIPPRCPQ